MDEKKVREAIELIRMEINTLEGIENCGRVIEARKKKHIALYNITIEALEKQLPKKVDVWANGTQHCPVCDKDLTYTGFHICPECYQRLCYTK
jgi:hypothetical protein